MLPIEHAINLFLEMGYLCKVKNLVHGIKSGLLARAVKRNSVKINMHTCITIYKLNSL